MSVESMARAIEAEAAIEAAEVIARARAEADGIVARAEAQEAQRLSDLRAREGPAARAEAARGVNAVRLRLLERRAALLADRVTEAFATAEATLGALGAGADPERWSACLGRLAAEGLRLAGPDASILACPSDAATLCDLASAELEDVEILVDERVGPGLVVRSQGHGVEIDATIPARLATARLRLADVVASAVAVREPR